MVGLVIAASAAQIGRRRAAVPAGTLPAAADILAIMLISSSFHPACQRRSGAVCSAALRPRALPRTGLGVARRADANNFRPAISGAG